MKRRIQELEEIKTELETDLSNLEYHYKDMEKRHLEKETKKEELFVIKSKFVELLQLLNMPCTMDSVFENVRECCATMTCASYSDSKTSTLERSKLLVKNKMLGSTE